MRPLAILLYPGVRARAYLQAMVRSEQAPDHAVLLGDDEHDVHRVQWGDPPAPDFDPREDLRTTLARAGITTTRVPTLDINEGAVADAIRATGARWVVFTGGGLLRANCLASAPNWIHVHPGWLPDQRGSTCIHYGLLLNGRVGVSALLMRAGIDRGPILLRRWFRPDPRWTPASLDHAADAWMRTQVLVQTLQGLAAPHALTPTEQPSSSGQTYYVIHPVLKHLALQRLEALPPAGAPVLQRAR